MLVCLLKTPILPRITAQTANTAIHPNVQGMQTDPSGLSPAISTNATQAMIVMMTSMVFLITFLMAISFL